MWNYPTNDNCCIYRVRHHIRKINPEAYTPQIVLIGPLQHTLKSQALDAHRRGDAIPFTKAMSMETLKKTYLEEFTKRLAGGETINSFKKTIEEEEDKIKESYEENFAGITSSEFKEMVLQDSVFLVEFMLRSGTMSPTKIGDPLVDEPGLVLETTHDLMLLENQLPFFILEKLFDPVITEVCQSQTFRELTLKHFALVGKISDVKFRHFTDLYRGILVETLPKHNVKESNSDKCIFNADKLHSGGVRFEAIEEAYSISVSFENGSLKMPRLKADDDEERELRNIMALEQCHYPYEDLVCQYVFFLDKLINNERDVDLLVEKGILYNTNGESALTVRMVNKLGLGILRSGNYYSDMAVKANRYSTNWVNRSRALLKHVCFVNPLIGIITMAAICVIVMNIIQTWGVFKQKKI